VALVVKSHRADLVISDPAALLVDRVVRLNLVVLLVVLATTSHKAFPDHMGQPDIQDLIYHQFRKERE